MPFERTVFMYKCKIRMLLQIIHAVLVKRFAEAALIALSTFFLSTKFIPFPPITEEVSVYLKMVNIYELFL